MSNELYTEYKKKVGKDKIILKFHMWNIKSIRKKYYYKKRADKGTWGLPGGAIELGDRL